MNGRISEARNLYNTHIGKYGLFAQELSTRKNMNKSENFSVSLLSALA